jgi:hypothetical protein
MAQCSLCTNTGYKHVIDIQGQHYDITESEEPIYHSISDSDSSFAVCHPCSDKIMEARGVSFLRDYLYKKEKPVKVQNGVMVFSS